MAKRPAKRPTKRQAVRRVKAAAMGLDADKAKTLIYIHGIGNKPEEAVLRCQWDHALLGFGLGERSRMAYWCQADRHGPPETSTCAQADSIGARSLRAAGFGARAIERAVADEASLFDVADELADNPAERAALKRLLRDMDAPEAPTGGRARSEQNRSRKGPRRHQLLRSADAPGDRPVPERRQRLPFRQVPPGADEGSLAGKAGRGQRSVRARRSQFGERDCLLAIAGAWRQVRSLPAGDDRLSARTWRSQGSIAQASQAAEGSSTGAGRRAHVAQRPRPTRCRRSEEEAWRRCSKAASP